MRAGAARRGARRARAGRSARLAGRATRLALAALSTIPASLAGQWAELDVPARPVADSAAVAAGRIVYQRHCWYCHGEEGDGAGPVAATLWPRPRDFTIASFKLRTTGSGELPTDEDLYRSITLGLPGTAMPAWGSILDPVERWQVIAYLKTFAGGLFEDPAFDPYAVTVDASAPAGAGDGDDVAALGRDVYERSDCWECHGHAGRGDGQKAPDLQDDRGYPTRAADLESGATFRGGSDPLDVYLRLGTGLDGTPMPSYAQSLTDEERWEVAAYVASLDLTSRRDAARSVVIVAREAGGPLPAGPDDEAWSRAPETWIPLTGQATFAPRWQIPATTELAVRALYDDEEIALRLSWNDASADTLPGDPERERTEGWTSDETMPTLFPDGTRARGVYADAVEAMIPSTPGRGLVLPHFVYGDAGHPVRVWRWSAGRVEELAARGADAPPQAAPPDGQRPRGVGTYVDGRWTVVLRSARDGGEGAPAGGMEVGSPVPIAFHVRDGAQGETGLRMALSQWYFLFLEESARPGDFALVLLVVLGGAGLERGIIRALRRRAAEGRLDDYLDGPAGPG